MKNTAVYMDLRGRRVEEWVRRGKDVEGDGGSDKSTR
jgi:hypothetical protein